MIALRPSLSFLLFLLLLPACADYKLHYAREAADWQQDRPPQDLQLEHRMYLVGDAGNAPLGGTTPVLKYLKKVLAEEGPNSSILFLGDNIYPDGLPPKEDVENRTLAEYRLRIQLEALENFQGRPIFLPGNHDWRNGLKGLRSQEKMVEKFLNKGIEDDDDWENYFLPDGGCPGPEVVELNDKLVVIVIDTQWWLADWDKEPRIHEGCEIKNKFMFRFMFENAVRKHRSKNVVIAMHHPVHSFGPHGGRFTWKEHLFPFTEIKDNLYIPFPIVGTVYAFLRGSIATKQDINHQEYKELTESLLAGVKKNGSFIFAAGHEHNLQYIERDFQKYIISGAGSKISPAGLGKGGFFSYGRKGYATLEFYEDGQAWVQFWVPNAEGTDARLVFQKKVKDKLSTIEENIPTEFPEYEQLSDTVTRPLVRYELEPKGPIHNFLFGEHYRDLYLRQYRLPVLDLSTWRGGMTPIQRGGGNQTNSLRLADAQGHQFVMRDLTKDVTRLLPFPFNKMSLAQFIAVDNFLSTHPYAPLALPPMAEAIRIYHTNPEFFYIPKQPALGIHNDIYGGSVYLVEERPGGSWEGTDVFGGAHKFVSTPELSEKLTTKYSHRVDQPWALRSRLFDFVIGDWDRHDDQWRWARFDQPDGIKLYRPVPRDRDQAFSKYDGLFTRIATITAPFLRQLRVYSPKIGNIKWAAWSPRHFDNSFLNQLDWNEWENQVHFIQENLTDAVVDSAFLSWPDYPRQTSAPYIRQVLKQRRDQLLNTARRYYEFLSREVDVYGTEDRERFRIERLDDRRTRVRMYELSKKGKEKDLLYDRTFTHGPTREIHIYGLDGDDEFIVTGRVSKGVKLRLVGGLGEDLFHDESRVGGLGKKTLIYDNKLKNILETGPESRDKRSNRAIVNIYDRRAAHYEYDILVPFPVLGVNPDEGFLLGANLHWTVYQFKKEPYGATHNVFTSFAFETSSLLLEYQGDFLNAFGGWDFFLDGLYKNPIYSFNYFGFGNESVNEIKQRDDEFYRVRQGLISLAPALKKRLGSEQIYFTVGPSFLHAEIEATPGRYLTSKLSDVPPSAFEEQSYGGLRFRFHYYNVDDPVLPHRGVAFHSSVHWQRRLQSSGQAFTQWRTEFTVYQNLDRREQLVFATRLGFGHNFGDGFQFWQAPNLGGRNSSLRGYRAERFYGRVAFWHNLDLRARLFSSYNPTLPFTFGLFAGFDYGRVWVDDDPSEAWHYDWGGGIWIAPVDAFALSVGLFTPREDAEESTRLTVKLGFGF